MHFRCCPVHRQAKLLVVEVYWPSFWIFHFRFLFVCLVVHPCHQSRWIAEPQKHRSSHCRCNFVSILLTYCDTSNSSL